MMKLAGLAFTALSTGTRRSRAWAATGRAGGLAQNISCVLSPEQTDGPYYISKEKVRSDITEHKPGTPLQLRLSVLDAASCKPITGATVDIWHCDAGGVYSGFVAASTGAGPDGGANKTTFLRGIQPSNARGAATFGTIYSGWYAGRTVHIHVKVHLGGTVVHTGQLYFMDALTDQVHGTGQYKSRASARTTRNSNDGIYANGGRQPTLTMKCDGRGGFIGSIALGVRRG
jgi:protocatechuate 3,4-dioxygenase beta subunit